MKKKRKIKKITASKEKNNKKSIKKTSINQKIKVPKKLQAAFDRFPQVLKNKEKSAKERKRIMKIFLSAKDDIFRS